MHRRFHFRYLGCTLLLAFFASASIQARAAPEINYWNVDKLLTLDAQELELSDGRGGTLGALTRERLLLFNEVRRRLEKSAGIRADLYFATGEQPFIFSSQLATGRNLVCITLPMLAEIGGDVDALAALLGHELAHLKLGHERLRVQEVIDLERTQRTVFDVISLFLMFARIGPAARAPTSLSNSAIYGPPIRQGIVTGTAIGAAEAAVTTGAMVATFASFTREQEREADRQGIEIASEAGFNPHGGVRIVSRILLEKGDKWSPYGSMHQAEDERVASMRKDIGSDPRASLASETEITKVEVPYPKPRDLRAIAFGESRPTLHDSEQRVPTLHERIRCKLQDASEVPITRLECVQRQGTPVR